MKTAITTQQDPTQIAVMNDVMQHAGQAANEQAARGAFDDQTARKAGTITPQESILIGSVQGYASKEARHRDNKRRADGMQTRKGAKKAEAVTIPENIAQALKAQPGTTGQGRRDALIMCLLLDHGFRVSEIAAPADGILWRKSSKGTGKLSSQMSETSSTRALTKRVDLLGRHAGIEGLSANDARHHAG